MSKVLLLHSNLHGADRLIDKVKTAFPKLEVVPILFIEKRTTTTVERNESVVNLNNLKVFCKTFDFSEVIAIQISFMTGSKVFFIKHAPKHIKVIWGIPGGDLYNRYLRYFGYRLTYNSQDGLKYKIGALYRKFYRRKEFNYLMNRCCAVICAHCDYQLIQEYCLIKKRIPSHVYSIAYPMDKMLGDLYGQPFVKHNKPHIIIGNSASRTNNHLYVLSFLKNISLGDAKIELLMTYGDSDDLYKKEVRSAYLSTYGGSVVFENNHAPLDVFNKKLLSVSHFVYGNWRQEAVGNILTALYFGGKVYLSEHNPLLRDLKEKGFVVSCLEKIDVSFLSPLTVEEKRTNRELIESLYNTERAATLFKQGLAPFYQN